jgi:crotonobetainyl-CoA:carnitine CoA-transferase CaiB-like acyl-CoA transferase
MATLPLEGIRVLDASNTYAGPTCARVLSDLGAEVIHVEAMQRWETVRLIIMPENQAPDDFWNGGAYFQKRNLGKKDITLDLTRPAGVEAFKQIVAHCDVMLESFAPRIMRGFGLDYDSVRAVRPDIIYCSLSGYGQSGPYRDWIAYGMGLEPASGISQLTGYPGGGPMRSGISLTDPLSGLAAAVAVLIALYHRRRTGEGQYIDLSEHEAAIPLVAGALLDQQMNGRAPERRGNRSWFAAPQGVYPCAGDDEWIAITCHTDAEWGRLCDATGHPEWRDDVRFADVLARHAHHDVLDELIAGWTRGQEKLAAMEHLQRAGVRAGAVLHGRDLLENEHLRARGHFDWIEHPVTGRRPFPRQLPVRFSKMGPGPRGHAPLLGEHNDEVLATLAGLTPAEIAALREAKVIGDRPEPMLPGEFVQATVTWPLDVLMDVGAIRQVDSDYRERLGL